MRPPRWSALTITLILLALTASVRAGTPSGPRALVVLPPGEGNTVTMQEFLQNQSSGKCADLGPNWCDQQLMYRDWKFRDGSLSTDASHVADAVSTEHPAAGVTVVRD